MKLLFKFSLLISLIWIFLLVSLTGFAYLREPSFNEIKETPYWNLKTFHVQLLPDRFEPKFGRFLHYHINRGYYYPILYWKDKTSGKAFNKSFGTYTMDKVVTIEGIERNFDDIVKKYEKGEIIPVLGVNYLILLVYIFIPIILLFMLTGAINFVVKVSSKSR